MVSGEEIPPGIGEGDNKGKPGRRGVITTTTKLVAMKRRVRVMTNPKETRERITTITMTKEG